MLGFLNKLLDLLVRISKIFTKPPIDRKTERKAEADDSFQKAKDTRRPDPDDWRGR